MKRQPQVYFGPTVTGIDVSTYQDAIDWRLVVKDDEQIRFAIVRTGDGRSTDVRAVDNIIGARKVGLTVGSYHYFRADRDGMTQAKLVKKVWDAAGGFRPGVDLAPALDLETGSRRNLPGGVYEGPGDVPLKTVAGECFEHLDALEELFGAKPMLYSGVALHWWYSQGLDRALAARFGRYPLWLPSYSPKPLMPVDRRGQFFPHAEWSIWQYTASGQVDGIERKLGRGRSIHRDVDMNAFRGDYPAFLLFVQAQAPCAPP